MPYALTRTTDATVEPLTTAEAKAHLRVTGSGEDTLIDNLVKSARQLFEERTGRALVNQTWRLKLDSWFACDGQDPWISLPKGPLSSVTSISYVDAAGDSQTWSSSDYLVDSASEPARITPAYGEIWPVTRAQLGAITITYVAGYGATAASVPQAIKQALLIAVADMFENRATRIVGTIAATTIDYDLFWRPWKIADDYTSYAGAN